MPGVLPRSAVTQKPPALIRGPHAFSESLVSLHPHPQLRRVLAMGDFCHRRTAHVASHPCASTAQAPTSDTSINTQGRQCWRLPNLSASIPRSSLQQELGFAAQAEFGQLELPGQPTIIFGPMKMDFCPFSLFETEAANETHHTEFKYHNCWERNQAKTGR